MSTTTSDEHPTSEGSAAPVNGERAAQSVRGLPWRRQTRPRTVLVLGGGGMRGMAHIGVIRALRTLGMEIDAVVGTSIGSLIGALVAAGLPIEEIERHVESLEKEHFFRLNFVKFLMKGMRAPSMYSGERFRDKLQEILPQRTFADMSLPFFCNSVCLENGGSVFWGTPGFDVDLVDAVYASCALPGIFEPFEHDGKHFMDGGIVDALPLRFAKTLSPDLVIAVDLTVKATFKTPDYKSRVLSTLFRAFEIAEEVIVEQSLHMHADYRVALIQPKVGHLARLDFENIDEIVKLGEEEALKVLTSHAATRRLVSDSAVVSGLSCPVTPRDYVSVRIDPSACIGCGMCEMVCETDAFYANGERASVRKLSNYECTRDHACARNCPTGAISLGNL